MSISSRFAVGIHILALIEINEDGISTSEFLAGSVKYKSRLHKKNYGDAEKSRFSKSSARYCRS